MIEHYRNMPDNTKHLYNSLTIEDIKNNLPFGMPSHEVVDYIRNCERVIECQMSGMNLHEIEDLKNYNHRLIIQCSWFTGYFS